MGWGKGSVERCASLLQDVGPCRARSQRQKIRVISTIVGADCAVSRGVDRGHSCRHGLLLEDVGDRDPVVAVRDSEELKPRPALAAEEPGPPEAEDLEAELVAAARRHDAGAWARLCHDNFARLYRHVGYLVGDPDLAQDIAQETFARALASLHRFDGRSRFLTWLKGIASNVAYKHRRTRGRRQRALDRLEAMVVTAGDLAASPEDAHVSHRRAEVLLVVLDTLPEHLREAFVLCDLQRLSVLEAAEVLGISQGNTKVRASRARARIRRRLAELGWLPTASTGEPQ